MRGITDDIKTAKLFMIDLAGSERAAQTQVISKGFLGSSYSIVHMVVFT